MPVQGSPRGRKGISGRGKGNLAVRTVRRGTHRAGTPVSGTQVAAPVGKK